MYLVCSYDDICERTFCLQCARWLPTEIHSTHCQLFLTSLLSVAKQVVSRHRNECAVCFAQEYITAFVHLLFADCSGLTWKTRNEKWYFSDHTILMCWVLCLNIMSFGSDLKSFWYCLMDFGIMCHSSYHVHEMFIVDCIIFYERHLQKR